MDIPEYAIKPEKDNWINALRVGTFTPGNTGEPERFTVQRLRNMVRVTKEKIKTNDYPIINHGHLRETGIAGLINDIRFNNNYVQFKIGYLTPDMAYAVKEGRYPYRSAEIDIDDTTGDERLSGVAMTGYPAVNELGLTEFSKVYENPNQSKIVFSKILNEKNKNKKLIIFSRPKNNNLGGVLMDTSTGDIKKKIDFEKKFNELELKYSELEKELKGRDEKIIQLSSNDNHIDEKVENPEILELKEQIKTLEKDQQKEQLYHKISNMAIPGIEKSEVVEIMLTMDNSKSIKFTAGKDKEEISQRDFIFKLLNKINDFTKSLTNSQIQKPEFEFNNETNEIRVDLDNREHNEKLVEFIKKNSNENEIFNSAKTRLEREGKIKYIY